MPITSISLAGSVQWCVAEKLALVRLCDKVTYWLSHMVSGWHWSWLGESLFYITCLWWQCTSLRSSCQEASIVLRTNLGFLCEMFNIVCGRCTPLDKWKNCYVLSRETIRSRGMCQLTRVSLAGDDSICLSIWEGSVHIAGKGHSVFVSVIRCVISNFIYLFILFSFSRSTYKWLNY